MEQKYNVYFAGHVQEGRDPAQVRADIGKLFRADEATLAKLFSGTPQLLKKACDKATALKFKQAIERAGGQPVIKAIAERAQASTETGSSQAPSRAERIAALAAAPDLQGYREPAQSTAAGATDDANALASIEPPGSDLLRPEERKAPAAREVDTSGISLTEPGGSLSQPAPEPPPAPATDHLSLGDVGDDIPTLPDQRPPLDPDTSALGLSPQGTDFSDCIAPEAEAPELDLSDLDLAAAGSDMLEPAYRRQATATAPDTDHLSLDD